MIWILCALAALLGYLGFRHVTDRGRHSVSMGLVALMVLGLGFFVWRGHVFESDLAVAIRSLTGDSTLEVECQGLLREFRLDNNLGEVAREANGELSNVAQLRRSVCSEIRGYIGSDKSGPSREQVIAVHVLSHEAVHASGVSGEGLTECLAMQYDTHLAELLGATQTQAVALADRYWREVFPRMPNGYRAVDCEPNGALDTTPGDDDWPGRAPAVAIAAGL
jgi:hypothetical protein